MLVRTHKEPSQNPSDNIPTPVRIHNDILFLNASWANLAEKEADGENSGSKMNADIEENVEEQRNIEKEIDDALLREDQQNLEASGFKLVTRKAKRKTQKSKNIPTKNSHGTRSKSSNPRPFK